MYVTVEIALAHLKGRKRQTIISLLGIVLGVSFFIAVSSMMRGSEQDFMRRMIENNPHITIYSEYRDASVQALETLYPKALINIRGVKPRDDNRGILTYREIMTYLAQLPQLKAAAVLSGPAVSKFGGKEQNITLYGMDVDALKTVSEIREYIVEGSIDALNTDTNGILLGATYMDNMKAKLGDTITISSSIGDVRLAKIVGVFNTGNGRQDRAMGYMLLKRVQSITGKPNTVNRIITKHDNPMDAYELAAEVENLFGYRSESWQEASETMLSMMLMRNIVMYLVVSAILVVASIGIYNVIFMIVMEKNKDIAIMKSFGFLPSDIKKIFLMEGALMGFIGSVVGSAIGYTIILYLSTIRIRMPGPGARYDNMPLDFGIGQFLFAASVATGAAVLAAYLPAKKAGDVPPVNILRGAA